jgi:rhodanese-related sulfurtransferase
LWPVLVLVKSESTLTKRMKRRMLYLIAIPAAAVVLAGAAFLYVTRTESGFRVYLDRIYNREFSDVALVEPDSLARELAGSSPPVLIDTRSPNEYAVSHLRGATLVDPSAFTEHDVANVDKGRPIVVYCSIGYRSGRIAQKLAALGYSNVRNLYGGIFLWYNQGRPVYHGDSLVSRIHPYSGLWGLFVTRDGKTTE